MPLAATRDIESLKPRNLYSDKLDFLFFGEMRVDSIAAQGSPRLEITGLEIQNGAPENDEFGATKR